MLSCGFCWVAHIFISCIPTSPPPPLNNQAYGRPPLAGRPGSSQTQCSYLGSWSSSNPVITITCSLGAAPRSRCCVSNWPVPFAWLFWLLHFSLSPLWWLLWHYRCWASLITTLIGFEMPHTTLFFLERGAVEKHLSVFLPLKETNELHLGSRLWRRCRRLPDSRTTTCWMGAPTLGRTFDLSPRF